MGVRLTVVGARVRPHVSRLGQLVFEQNDIGIQGTALAQADPRLGNVWVRVETAYLDAAPVVIEAMFVQHHMPLRLGNFLRSEAGSAIGAGH